MSMHAHILIVEDHPLYRDALARVLALHPTPGAAARRCTSVATADEALTVLAGQLDIDVVIADWRLQQGDGLDLLCTVGQRWPTVARVLLSGAQESSLSARARRLGLMAYIPKALEPAEIAQVIERVLTGEYWFPVDAAVEPVLTPRQARVLTCVAEGQPNKDIARSLGISERTIKFHLEQAYLRLAVTNRAQAVASALERGLISVAR
jgi:DNA-binding NarL/FixJ family response regulator